MYPFPFFFEIIWVTKSYLKFSKETCILEMPLENIDNRIGTLKRALRGQDRFQVHEPSRKIPQIRFLA